MLATSATIIHHSRPWITAEDEGEVTSTLASGFVARGARVADFEAAVAEHNGLAGAVATSCGTAALTIALRALGHASDAEVILPTYVCRDVEAAVVAAGLRPVLCDVDDDGLVTAATVSRRITPRTAAVIVVHLFGRVADTASIAALGPRVIEDAAQAFGADFAPSSSVVRVFSFHATKCLTTGEGGMVASSDLALVDRMRALRDGDDGPRVAAPLSDLQAALGVSQLRRYPAMLARRRALAARYAAALDGLDVIIENQASFARGAAFRFTVRSRRAFEELESAFSRDGIVVRRGVDAVIHHAVGDAPGEFPMAERLFAETVSVPLYPALSDDEADRVASALTRIYGAR